jgi:acetyl-CoA carboxylase biotin carboxylase subunit
VYSIADKESLHVQLADEAVCIGEAQSSESYLNMANIIAAAVSRGADAIHPVSRQPVSKIVVCMPVIMARTGLNCSDCRVLQGYGFLSENATFVDICADHGIEFIGPRAEHIRIMGDKSTARDTMKVLAVVHARVRTTVIQW